MYAFLAYHTGDESRAEALLEDTLRRALRARRRVDPTPDGEKARLYTIALTVLREDVARAGGPAATADVAASYADALQAAMSGLTPDEREVVSLRYGAGLTVTEIARVIGEPVSTAEGRVYRALRKLRAALDNE
jgi:RNA polymerase sigma-70 factor (ECF subfamily)